MPLPRAFLDGLDATPGACPSVDPEQNENGTCPVDHRSFRDQLAFSIGFAVSRSRNLLRRLLNEHAPDNARQQLAARVVEHLEESGFEIDEAGQTLRRQPPAPLHRTPGE
jgi:hypothetical protein